MSDLWECHVRRRAVSVHKHGASAFYTTANERTALPFIRGGGGRLAAQFSSGCGRDVWFTCCGGRPRWADNRRSAETATLPCIILCIFLSFELRTWEEQGEMNRRVWLGEAVWFLAAVTTAKWKYLQNNMYTSWRTGIWISQSVRKGVAMYYGRCRQSFLQ